MSKLREYGGIRQCEAGRYSRAEARLTAAHDQILGSLTNDLATARKGNDSDKQKYEEEAIEKLQAADHAWIQYRDLHCGAAEHQYEGGSISPAVWSACMTLVTEHRIAELKQAYEEEPE
jgi:uncharacterized protein YecT (DUF1311 family)